MNRNFKKIISCILCVLCTLSSMCIITFADNTLYIEMPENPELITKNPGKGWIRYGTSNTNENPVTSEKALYYSKTGYNRFYWADINPSHGVYNWEPIDSAIEYWDARGIQFAFRIMTTSTGNKGPIAPEWIYDEGVPYEEDVGGSSFLTITEVSRSPYYNHPKYIELYTEFLSAMAERYDGDPRISYIDIGSYGNWGEFHVQGVEGPINPETNRESLAMTTDEMKAHIKMHTDVFEHTQLMVAGGIFYDTSNNGYVEPEWLIEMGVGSRNDGGYHVLLEEAPYFYAELPSVDEVGPPYDERVALYGPWNNLDYINYVKHHRFSYLSMGEWGTQTEHFIRDEESVIKYLTNKMGYHFVLNGVTLPGTVGAKQSFDIKFDWINKGIAHLFENCLIDVAILDKSDNVLKTYRSATVPTKSWAPDTPVSDTVELTLDNLANGEYKLAIGLQQDTYKNPYDGNPDFKIGNYGITEGGWYVFANAVKQGNTFSFSKYINEITANGTNVYGRVLNEDGTKWLPLEDTVKALSASYEKSDKGIINAVIDTVKVNIDTTKKVLSINGAVYNAGIKEKNKQLFLSLAALDAIEGVNVQSGENIVITTDMYTPAVGRYLELSNPGFELDNNSWSYDDQIFNISSEDKSEGERALAFNGEYTSQAHQTFEFDPGIVYNMSFKIKSEGPVTVKFIDGNDRELLSAEVDSTEGEWKDYNINFDYYDPGDMVLGIPMADAKATVVFEVGKDSGNGFIDDIKITEVAPYEDFLDEENVIKDYGAEISLLNAWTQRGNGNVTRSMKYAKSGQFSYCLKPSKAWDGTQFNLSSALSQSGAGTYKVEGWMRTDDGGKIDYISFYGLYYGGGENLKGAIRLENDMAVTDEWKYYSTEFEVTEELLDYIQNEASHSPVTLIGFGEHIKDDNGNQLNLYFDDIKFVKVK